MPKLSVVLLLATMVMGLSYLPSLAHASQEIRDSDCRQGNMLKVCAVLYKDTGEIDPSYDYWAVKVTLQDIAHQNNPILGPLYAGVRVAIQTWANEVPANHQPTAGWRWGQTGVGFSYQGISFQLSLPAYSVSYSESTDSSHRYFDWSVSGCPITGACWWYIFEDYSEYGIGVRVPAGYKPYVQVQGWAHWYQFICLPFFGCSFWYWGTNNVYWATVDPPGPRGPPSAPVEVPEPPQTLDKLE